MRDHETWELDDELSIWSTDDCTLVATVNLNGDPDVVAANAMLLVSAPDLLRACEQALVLLKSREHDQFLRSVIAKAKGRT